MAITMKHVTIALDVERVVGSIKETDIEWEDLFDVEAVQVQDTIVAAGAADDPVELYNSALILTTSYLIVKTDQPITIKLGGAGSDPITVNSIMVLTDPAILVFVSNAGADDANVTFIAGGVTT
jgi:hypothetical protein